MAQSESVILRAELQKTVSKLNKLDAEFKAYRKEAEEKIAILTCANRELQCKNDQLEEEIHILKGTEKESKKKMDFYESCNQSSSTISFYNEKRKKFREQEFGAKDHDSKAGAKEGHKGVSHNNKPERTDRYFVAKCENCGLSDIKRIGITNKLFH